jgi:putative hemolysin
MPSTNDNAQLHTQVQSLEKQVASLQQQLAQLQQFLRVEVRDDLEGSPSMLRVNCALLTICPPENPMECQGMLAGGSEGPSFGLWGSDRKARIVLKVEDDEPSCSLLGNDRQNGVALRVDNADRGEVAVYEAGKPRAIMKASDLGSAVSVVHDDGQPRAMLFAVAGYGEVMATRTGSDALAKLSCESTNGGQVIVDGNDGKHAVVLTASPEGGAAMVMCKGGGVGCSMATLEKVSGITVEDRGQGRVHLLSEASGPSIRLTDPEGRPRLSLVHTSKGAFLDFDSAQEQPLLRLTTAAGQPAFYIDNGEGDRITLQTAPGGGSILSFANPPDKPQLLLLHSKAGPSIALLPQSDRSAAATLGCTKEGGALFIADREGTRRCGICATDDGSQLMLFNDLGIERVLLGSAQDGGALKLNWGGTVGVAALATQDGGAVIVNDAEGEPKASLPPKEE